MWATSVVLASFMAGLALGNALAARYGSRTGRPLVAYALLEMLVAGTGVGLVFAWPTLGTLLTPLFRAMLGAPLALNATRLAVAFLLMLVPAAAMGATLPLLARALGPLEPAFGRLLGRLYGWNTLGAVAGATGGRTAARGRARPAWDGALRRRAQPGGCGHRARAVAMADAPRGRPGCVV